MKNRKFHFFRLFFALTIIFIVSFLFCQTEFVHSVYSTLFANANTISYFENKNQILSTGLANAYIAEISVQNKEYDGTTEIEVLNVVAKNEDGDIIDISIDVDANTLDANAGTNKLVQFSNFIVTGEDANVYVVAGCTNDFQPVSVNVLPKNTTLNWLTKDMSLPNNPKTAETGIYTYTGVDQKNGVVAYYDDVFSQRKYLNVIIKEKNSSIYKNELKDAGEYEASAVVSMDDGNYNLLDLDGDRTLDLRINKAISQLSFDNNTTFTYNGLQQDLSILFSTNNNEIDMLVFKDDCNYFTSLSEVPSGRTLKVKVPETKNYLSYPSDGNYASYLVIRERFLKKTTNINVDLIPTTYTYTGLTQEIEKLAYKEDDFNLEQTIKYSNSAQFLNSESNRQVEIYLKETENFNASSKTIYIDILKAKIDTSNWSWSPSVFTYNNQEHGVYINNYNQNLVDIEYNNNKATNAGVYVATANIILKDPSNYEGVAFPYKIWKIDKSQVTKPNLEDKELFYTGVPQSIKIDGEEYGFFVVTNNLNTNAGKYLINISLTNPNNYEWKDKTVDNLTINLTINKAKVPTPIYSKTLNYTGEELFVQIPTNDLYGVFGSKQTEVGSYEAYLILNDENNYEWQDNPGNSYLVIQWEITNANYSSSSSILAIVVFSLVVIIIAVSATLHFTIKARRRRRKKKVSTELNLNKDEPSTQATVSLAPSNSQSQEKTVVTEATHQNKVIKEEEKPKAQKEKEEDKTSLKQNKTNGKPRKKRMLSMKKNDKKERRKKENLKLSKLKKAPAKRGRPPKKKPKSKKQG